MSSSDRLRKEQCPINKSIFCISFVSLLAFLLVAPTNVEAWYGVGPSTADPQLVAGDYTLRFYYNESLNINYKIDLVKGQSIFLNLTNSGDETPQQFFILSYPEFSSQYTVAVSSGTSDYHEQQIAYQCEASGTYFVVFSVNDVYFKAMKVYYEMDLEYLDLFLHVDIGAAPSDDIDAAKASSKTEDSQPMFKVDDFPSAILSIAIGCAIASLLLFLEVRRMKWDKL